MIYSSSSSKLLYCHHPYFHGLCHEVVLEVEVIDVVLEYFVTMVTLDLKLCHNYVLISFRNYNNYSKLVHLKNARNSSGRVTDYTVYVQMDNGWLSSVSLVSICRHPSCRYSKIILIILLYKRKTLHFPEQLVGSFRSSYVHVQPEKSNFIFTIYTYTNIWRKRSCLITILSWRFMYRIKYRK